MRPHPRIRKTVQWGGLALFALSCAAWAVTLRHVGGVTMGPAGALGITSGCLTYNRVAGDAGRSPSGVQFAARPKTKSGGWVTPMRWGFTLERSSWYFGASVPLWVGKFVERLGVGEAAFVQRVEKTCGIMNRTDICFVAGTPVHTARGLVPIEQICVGDLVLAQFEDRPGTVYQPVLEVIQTHPAELVRLAIVTPDGRADFVLGTPVHPVWCPTRQSWVFMGDLEVGDEVQLATGEHAAVADVARELAPMATSSGRFTTYNLDVACADTYFVGQAGVWVHNDGPSVCPEQLNRIHTAFRWALRRLNGENPCRGYSTARRHFPDMSADSERVLGWMAVKEIDELKAAGRLSTELLEYGTDGAGGQFRAKEAFGISRFKEKYANGAEVKRITSHAKGDFTLRTGPGPTDLETWELKGPLLSDDVLANPLAIEEGLILSVEDVVVNPDYANAKFVVDVTGMSPQNRTRVLNVFKERGIAPNRYIIMEGD